MSTEPIGFPERKAARLAGVSVRTLRAWRDLVEPSHARVLSERNRPAVYSFDDMVSLRVLALLRKRRVRTAVIRRLIRHLRTEFEQPLSELVWATAGPEVLIQRPDGTWAGHRAPDQLIFREVIDLDLIRDQLRRSSLRETDSSGLVRSDRRIVGSQERFAGTRIPLSTVRAWLDSGHSPAEVLEQYPSLTPADLRVVGAELESA